MTNDIFVCDLTCEVKKRKGVSKKTGNPYEMTLLVVDTVEYGKVEITLDTRSDKAGIVIDMLCRKEGF